MASLLTMRPLFGSAVVFRLSLYALFMRILGGFMGPLCAQSVGSSTLNAKNPDFFVRCGRQTTKGLDRAY